MLFCWKRLKPKCDVFLKYCNQKCIVGILLHCWAGLHIVLLCLLMVQMLSGECWLRTVVLLHRTWHNDSIHSLLTGMNNTFIVALDCKEIVYFNYLQVPKIRICLYRKWNGVCKRACIGIVEKWLHTQYYALSRELDLKSIQKRIEKC